MNLFKYSQNASNLHTKAWLPPTTCFKIIFFKAFLMECDIKFKEEKFNDKQQHLMTKVIKTDGAVTFYYKPALM